MSVFCNFSNAAKHLLLLFFLFVYTAHVSVCLFYLYFLLKIQREPSSKHGLGLIQASYFHAVITPGDLCHLLKMMEQMDML